MALWGLEQFDLFKGLNPNEIQTISPIVRKVSFSAGDIITDQGGKSRDVFVLVNGRVDVVSLQNIPLYRVSPGETFGELALIPNLKRTASVIAREPAIVLVLTMTHLDALGIEHPAIHKTISVNIVTSLGIKLARANKLIELLKTELAKTVHRKTTSDDELGTATPEA